jgi:hypothetical protein
MGGLGNQMFQYATARRLSHIHNTALKLDLNWFDRIAAIDVIRKYELNMFAIQEDFASSQEIANLIKTGKGRIGKLFKRVVHKTIPLTNKSYIREKHFQFDSSILKLPDNVCIEGYWQCDKYFKDIDYIIRKEFALKHEPNAPNRKISETIAREEAVSIHVRRGDYVANTITNKHHGTCPQDYYNAAIKIIDDRVRHPHFFIFSDDPDWVKKNLKLICPATFVDHNGLEKAYEDMRLMSLCKHHIIANSSFSWWGAWLNKNHDKIVIAPKKWFNDESINTNDLIPEEWIRL